MGNGEDVVEEEVAQGKLESLNILKQDGGGCHLHLPAWWCSIQDDADQCTTSLDTVPK